MQRSVIAGTWLPVATVALSLFGSLPVRAEDASSLLEVLEESVVSGASRSAESASQAPAYSSVITGTQLRHLGLRRLDEALNFLSAGMFTHDRMSTPETGARGVSLTRDFNNHVLVVLDGMVMNEQAGGWFFYHDLPVELIDRVEVILGPGSVLYGNQAMLGVLNVVTRNPRDTQGVRGAVHFGWSPPIRADGSFGKPTLSNVGRDHRYALSMAQPLCVFGESGALLLGIDHADFDGPRVTFAYQPVARRADGSLTADYGDHTLPSMWGGPVDRQWFRRSTGGFARLELLGVSWTTRATHTDSAMPQMDLFENRVGGAYDDPANRNQYVNVLSNLRYDARLDQRLTGFGRIYFGFSRTTFTRLVLSHDLRESSVPLGVVDPEQCPIGPMGPCRKDSQFFGRWQGLELQGTYDWLGEGSLRSMLGVDMRLRTSAYEFVATDVATGLSYGSDPAFTRWHGGGHKSADEYAAGTYLQQSWRPLPEFTANLGARFDYDSRIPSQHLSDALSPRVALIAAPSDQVTLKGIYSTAFRAPSFQEAYIVNGRLLPNPDGLIPETVSSYELMGTLRSGAHRLTLGGFYTDWSNLIELQIINATAPSVSRYQNVSGIQNYGSNASYDSSFVERRLRVGVNATVAAARRKLTLQQRDRNRDFGVGETVPLTVAPRVYGNAHASYSFEQNDTTLAFAVAVLGPRIADQAYYGGDISNLNPRPRVPTQVELRSALTGQIPTVSAVGYTIGFNFAFEGHQPYVIGPNQGLPRYLAPDPVDAELALENRLTLFLGLDFALEPDAFSSHGEAME